MVRRALEGTLQKFRLQYLLWRPFSETLSGLNNHTEEKVPSISVRSCMEARIAIPLALRERIRSAISSCRPMLRCWVGSSRRRSWRLLGETERDLDPLTLPSAQLIEDAARSDRVSVRSVASSIAARSAACNPPNILRNGVRPCSMNCSTVNANGMSTG
jgi:hypothetical protein